MRLTLRRGLLLALGAWVLLLATAVLYLTLADLSGYRSSVERAVADAIGRELTIAGRFEPSISRSLRVVAEDVTLANVDWSDEPAMVHVDHLELTVDTWSLLFGPLRLTEVTIHGGTVRLEKDSTGRDNWSFDTGDSGPADADADTGVGVTFGEVELRDVGLVYDKPALAEPFVLRAESLDAHPTNEELLELRFEGEVAHRPLEFSGSLSTIERLIVGRDVNTDVSGRYGAAEFALHGSIARLAGLNGPALSLELQGPDSDAVTGPLGLPSLGSGSFSVSARTMPSGATIDLEAKAVLGLLQAEAHGNLDSFVAPKVFDLTVSAAGSDLAGVGTMIGVPDLPGEAFSVSGRLQRDETRTSFEQVVAHVGGNAVRLEGVLGKYPAMVDTDFKFSAAGPDLSKLGALLDLELPAKPFETEGRLVRRQAGIAFEGLRARIGESALRAEGLIGDPPEFATTSLELHANGPNLSIYSGLAGVELPPDAFELTGRVEHDEAGIQLESVSARLGESRLRVDGVVLPGPGLGGSDLRVRAEGPDLSRLGGMFGHEELPAAPFNVAGRVRPSDDGYRLDGVVLRLDDTEVTLDGLLRLVPDLTGTALRVVAAGSDLSRLGGLAGMTDLPAESFRLSGHARVLENGYALEAVAASVGGIEVEISGHLARPPGTAGTDVDFNVRLEQLSALSAFVDEPPLPAQPFRVSGRVRGEQDGYTLTGVVGDLAGNRFRVDGVLGPLPDLEGTAAAVELSGPDLSALGRMIAETGLAELPELRAGPFDVAGRVRVDSMGYEIEDAVARADENEIRVHGRLGSAPRFVGLDLAVEGHGPDVTRILPLAETGLPAEPFRVAGRVERLEEGLRFHGVRASLGDYHADVDGHLGEPPRLLGTLLDVRIEGPDPGLFTRFVDLPRLPAESFAVSGHLEGTAEEITLERLSARLGSSDLAGSFRLDLRDKPDLKGEFTSSRIDLALLVGGSQADRDSTADSADRSDPDTEMRRLLIPDDPLAFGVLQDVNLELQWTIDELRTPKGETRSLSFALNLTEGRLLVGPIEARGKLGEAISARVVLEPAGDRYRLAVDLRADQLRPDLIGYGDDRSQWPPVDIELRIAGAGASPHAIAGSADGWLTVIVGEGNIDHSPVDLVAADMLLNILGTLNPFAKEEPYTRLECGVMHVELENGKAVGEDLAVRTDKMTMVGDGRIDFKTEELDLHWIAKPREGVGISASAITNPYTKLGGTLSDPAVEIKPFRAATSTGAAVATMGVSILARGLWDRVSAERRVCTRALEKIEKKAAERETQPKR